ncbi:hypothetical protein [Stenotrophomonas sp. SMYL20]|uniref:hypothetical protein n=1 Tax=Stenotrophomonas sp. SMYL20 TaxID=3076043 RepID=UPI002E7798BF|nr:hypothetical protein [Stenotrophomonas sp. SMYL20]
MSNDNKTLADVQPGGRVRLGDGLAVEKLARELLAKEWDGLHTEHMSWSDTESGEVEAAWIRSLIAALLRDQPVEPLDHKGGCGSVASARELLDLYADPIPVAVENGSWFMVREQDALDAIRAALSAQPSPGGQGDASHYWPEVDRILVDAYVAGSEGDEFDMIAARNAIHTALAARQPSKQPDSVALGEATEFCIEKGDRQPAGEQPAIPEGWALVDLAEYTVLPQTPTTAMMDAGWPIGEQITDQFDVKGAYADLIAEHEAKGEGIIHGPIQVPAQAVDLGGMPEGWRLSKKATCYQLSHGNDIIGNLVGPDAEENAAIIARVLDSQAVGK